MSLPNVSPPPPLEIDGNFLDNWKMWKQMWQNYVIISGLEEKDNKYKSALQLHSLGIEALRIYNGMKFDATKQEDKENPDHIIAKFDTHFIGETKEFF